MTGVLHQAPPAIFRGDGKDQFDINYNAVFTPASNPSTDLYNNPNKIGFELTGTANGVCTMNIHVNTVLSASPSKPQDLKVGIYGSGHPRLTWTQMQEPDVQSSGGFIHIERRLKPLYSSWSAWTQIGSIAGSLAEYIDYTIYQACQGSCPDSVQYRIRAQDNTGKYSVYSDPSSKTYYYFKQGANEALAKLPERFELLQNYPNPFNPTTTINYQIPRQTDAGQANDGFVSLKVFNTLGQEVATLVNEVQPAGSYSVPFDASKLSSGVYIYTLKAGNFTASKKFVLLK